MAVCCVTYRARGRRSIFFMEASDRIGCVCFIHILLLSLHFNVKKIALAIFTSEIQNIAETALQQQMNLLHMH